MNKIEGAKTQGSGWTGQWNLYPTYIQTLSEQRGRKDGKQGVGEMTRKLLSRLAECTDPISALVTPCPHTSSPLATRCQGHWLAAVSGPLVGWAAGKEAWW